jgi:hypothetical protein
MFGFGEFRDVVGDLAFIDGSTTSVDLAQDVAQRGCRRLHLADEVVDFVVGAGRGHWLMSPKAAH